MSRLPLATKDYPTHSEYNELGNFGQDLLKEEGIWQRYFKAVNTKTIWIGNPDFQD